MPAQAADLSGLIGDLSLPILPIYPIYKFVSYSCIGAQTTGSPVSGSVGRDVWLQRAGVLYAPGCPAISITPGALARVGARGERPC